MKSTYWLGKELPIQNNQDFYSDLMIKDEETTVRVRYSTLVSLTLKKPSGFISTAAAEYISMSGIMMRLKFLQPQITFETLAPYLGNVI
jgi:hypothetical protein